MPADELEALSPQKNPNSYQPKAGPICRGLVLVKENHTVFSTDTGSRGLMDSSKQINRTLGSKRCQTIFLGIPKIPAWNQEGPCSSRDPCSQWENKIGDPLGEMLESNGNWIGSYRNIPLLLSH